MNAFSKYGGTGSHRQATILQVVSGGHRILARLRSACPLLPLTLGTIIGQILVWYSGALAALIGVAAVAWPLLVARSRLSSLTMGLCLGALSMGLLLAGVPLPIEAVEGRVMGEVTAPPRRPVPGAIQFDLKVLGTINTDLGEPQGRIVRCRAIDLPWREVDGLRRGDQVVVYGSMRSVEKPVNPFSYQAGLIRHGISGECKVRFLARISRDRREGFFDELRFSIGQRVIHVLGNHERAGLVLALVLGERDGLGVKTENAFRKTGLSHLLVLSGYQISLVFAVVFLVLRQLFRLLAVQGPSSAWIPSTVSLLVTAGFVALVGIDHSSFRAAIAVALVCGAKLSERHCSLWASIVASMFVLCLLWPGSFFEPGVQLTFAALAGIAIGAERGDCSLWKYFRTSFWATVLPLGVGALWFNSFSPGGVMLNAVLAPLISACGTLGGGGALLLHLFGFDRSGAALGVIADGLVFFRGIVLWCSRLPGVGMELSPLSSVVVFASILIGAGLAMLSNLRSWLKRLNILRLVSVAGCKVPNGYSKGGCSEPHLHDGST